MNDQTTNQDAVVETPVINQELPLQTEPQPVGELEPELPPQPESTPEPLKAAPKIEKAAPSNEYQQVLNEYAANTQRLPTIEAPPKSPEEQLKDLGISTPPKTNGFLKFLFTLVLIVFIFIAVALGFVYFKTKQTNTNTNINSNPDSSSFDTAETSPTPASETCFLNEKTYLIGDNFYAADGCNICTCDAVDGIYCTEDKVCAPTAVPTKSATTSSIKKVVPTTTQSATQN
jgi:hypothetical protein